MNEATGTNLSRQFLQKSSTFERVGSPKPKKSATVWISVTRWQIYMFLKWLLTTLIKLAQKQTKFAKVLSKYCLIILNFCQNDEIAPNLVTLGSELTSKYFGGTRQVNFRQVPNGISET